MEAHDPKWIPHNSHWGAFFAKWENSKLSVRPHPVDPDPNRLIENLPSAINHRARVRQPMVRKGWLKSGPGPSSGRGNDQFVSLPWEEALDLLADELKRVQARYGTDAIFGGSYGWSSAGRFHHAQSQLHRFLNTVLGGYVRSVNNYSSGAAMVLLPHVLGDWENMMVRNITWSQIVDHTDIVLAFGGLPLKNAYVSPGGVSRHIERGAIERAANRGCKFFAITPIKSDLTETIDFDWISVKPGTDTALMLALIHSLVTENLHDQAFLSRYTSGWSEFEDYVLGKKDGVAKSAAWAAPLCGISRETIVGLARLVAGKRVVVSLSHSIQRAEHGEQPVWAGLALACALGQPGLPGGGYSYALGAMAKFGRRLNAVPIASLNQGKNNVESFIPVARIADMLLHPGQHFHYNGRQLTYPSIKLAYWAGGNPFHHHQDLGRLTRAIQRLDTFVVHEIAWTATARHADIVLPSTMTLERNDIGGSSTDPLLIAMQKVVEPFGQSRNDYDIFSELSARLDRKEAYTEGRTEDQWLRYLYECTRVALDRNGHEAPDFDTFWSQGSLDLPQLPDDGGIIAAFRQSPESCPLSTPSGRIQIVSKTIASFEYADCPGYPSWIPPQDGPTEEYPLHLIANQPHSKLHGQLDYGDYSVSHKRKGREICTIHPSAATARGISNGDLIRIFNARGSCLATATISENILETVVQLPTGSWYDPDMDDRDLPFCMHGNPNVLTRDVGTSALAQATTGQLTTVQIERFTDSPRAIRAFEPPESV